MAHSRPRPAIPSTARASTGAARASLRTAGAPPGAVQRSSSAASARSAVAPADPDAATNSTAGDAAPASTPLDSAANHGSPVVTAGEDVRGQAPWRRALRGRL